MDNSYFEGVKAARQALEEKKAEQIKLLDLEGVSDIADYFIIASGKNTNQLRAMADEVESKLFSFGYKLHHSEGYASANWILLDFGFLIVHLFNQEEREFYRLDKMWGDAKDRSSEA